LARIKYGAIYLLEPGHGIEVLLTINPLVCDMPSGDIGAGLAARAGVP
jgi:hypothetical protein